MKPKVLIFVSNPLKLGVGSITNAATIKIDKNTRVIWRKELSSKQIKWLIRFRRKESLGIRPYLLVRVWWLILFGKNSLHIKISKTKHNNNNSNRETERERESARVVQNSLTYHLFRLDQWLKMCSSEWILQVLKKIIFRQTL